MINARSETVATLPAFREAFAQRRCLIPADGFYEWAKRGGVKQPYWIHPADGGLWAFAGLWERWRSPEGERVLSCTIVTTAANGYVATLHDRMPVVIGPGDYEKWLDVRNQDPESLAGLLSGLPPDAMEIVPVSTRVNKTDNDDAEVLNPIGPPLLRL
jgi:putative SOS response-associated peptidase YedK